MKRGAGARRILSLVALDDGPWRHPWNTRPIWNSALHRWDADINPGLVGGDDVTVSLPAAEIPQPLRSRFAAAGAVIPPTLDVRLSDGGRLPLTQFRAIGRDAQPTEIFADENGEIVQSFEPIPPFFQYRGVMPLSDDTDPAKVRLLRACDIVLYKDRMATSSQFTLGILEDAIIAKYDVTYVDGANPRSLGYLRVTAKYSPPAPPDIMQRIMGDWTDHTRDELAIATVYLMSLPGQSPDSQPDATWQPFVRHRVFWNLGHGTKAIEAPAKTTLTLNTGLAAGFGDRVNGFLLGQVNDANSVLSEFLGRSTIGGRFWSR